MIVKSQPQSHENIDGKGEIARNEPFFFFPQCHSYRINKLSFI